MSQSHPQGWDALKLGAIVSFQTGKLNSNAAKPDGQYPFFTCSQETFRTDTYSFDTECVLLAGNNANGVFPIKYYSGKFDAYQRTYVIQPLDKKNLSIRFLYYALQLQLELFRSLSTGATTKFLTLTILNGIDMVLPPLPTQRKIAAILSAYDDLIENNTRRIALLERMAQLLYREWFVRFRFPGHESVRMVESALGEIPEGWEVVKVGELLAKIERKKKIPKQDYEEEGIPVIDQGREFIGGYTSDSKAVYEPLLPIIVFGDHTRILKYVDFPFACGADGTQLLKSNTDRMPDPLLYYTLQAVDLSDFAYARHFKFLKEERIVLPSSELAGMFADYVNPLRDLIRALSTREANLRRTRDLLLPRLIAGEVDVEHLSICTGV